MKFALLFLFIGCIILILLQYYLDVNFETDTVDIHIHDTYYVLSYDFIVIFSLLFLGTFFSVGGTIYGGFKSRKFLLLLGFFILADYFFTYDSLKLFKKLNRTTREPERQEFKRI